MGCSMAEISHKCEVSQGSINNFAKKFCSGGFSAFKLQIASNLYAHSEVVFSAIDSKKGIKDAMELKIKENITAFQNTLMVNDEEQFKIAVDKIMSAEKIEIYGAFHSGIAARDFCYQLMQLGIPASYISDTLMGFVAAATLPTNGLLIAVSSTGRTKEIIEAAQIAKGNGVPIISITSKNSPLAKISDAVLITTVSNTTISDRQNEIRLSQLLVIDTICSYIRSVIDTEGKEHYYKLVDVIGSHAIKD
jgi:RpiR family carbohydrate utilization transcriptional regulator